MREEIKIEVEERIEDFHRGLITLGELIYCLEKCNRKYEFSIVRENALANPNLYGGRYTQEDENEAWEEFSIEWKKEN